MSYNNFCCVARVRRPITHYIMTFIFNLNEVLGYAYKNKINIRIIRNRLPEEIKSNKIHKLTV